MDHVKEHENSKVLHELLSKELNPETALNFINEINPFDILYIRRCYGNSVYFHSVEDDAMCLCVVKPLTVKNLLKTFIKYTNGVSRRRGFNNCQLTIQKALGIDGIIKNT